MFLIGLLIAGVLDSEKQIEFKMSCVKNRKKNNRLK
jgi:hypothetical protein